MAKSNMWISNDIKKDIISVIAKSVDMIKTENIAGLRSLSNSTIHNASIFQDKYSVLVAVIMYAMSKMIERTGRIGKDILEILKQAEEYAKNDERKRLDTALKKIIREISKKDKELNKYIQHVINEAEIKKGSRIYEHGISLAQTAEILGISQWELMIYIGHTNIADEDISRINTKKRIEYAKSIFGLAR